MRNVPLNRNKMLLAALVMVALVAVSWLALQHKPADAAVENAPPAVAVDIASVARADVPIFLQGLGTVQAFYTVTVTARVDGELQKIGFVEGQAVRKGDLLAQIDPRPNQAAFEQAVAVLRKHGRVPDRTVDCQTDEPAKQQVCVEPLHQLPLRAHRIKGLCSSMARNSRSGAIDGRPILE